MICFNILEGPFLQLVCFGIQTVLACVLVPTTTFSCWPRQDEAHNALIGTPLVQLRLASFVWGIGVGRG